MKTKNIGKITLLAALTCAPLAATFASDNENTTEEIDSALEENKDSKGLMKLLKEKWTVLMIVLILILSVGLAFYLKRQRDGK